MDFCHSPNKAKHLRLRRRNSLIIFSWICVVCLGFFSPKRMVTSSVCHKGSLASAETPSALSASRTLILRGQRGGGTARVLPDCIQRGSGPSPTRGQALGKGLPKDKSFLMILIRSIFFFPFNLKVVGHCNQNLDTVFKSFQT